MTDRDVQTGMSHTPASPSITPVGIEILVADEQKHVVIDEALLLEVTRSVLNDEGILAAEISLAIVSDREIQAIHRQFLNLDTPTDVLSFQLDETDDPAQMGSKRQIEGEIVISGETAVRAAGEYGCSPREELTLYLVHGLLHLCGYDDQTEDDRQQMRTRECMHLQKFGIEPHY